MSKSFPPVPEHKSKPQKRANGQGTVYQLKGKRRWRAEIYDINGIRRTKVFVLKKDADSWLESQRWAREHGQNTHALHPKMKMSEFLLNWIESYKINIRPSTYLNYQGTIVNRINPIIGNLVVSKVNVRSLEDFFAQLQAKGYAGGTILGAYRVLSAAFNDAVRLNELPFNPLTNARKPSVVINPTKPIGKKGEEDIYREASKNPYDLARIEIGMISGVRPGEVLGLKWSDLDVERKVLIIERQVERRKGVGLVFGPPKTGGPRPLFLTSKQLEILESHRISQLAEKVNWTVDEDLIFPNQNGGKFDSRGDDRRFKKLCERAGHPNLKRYQMRKSAYTNLANAGTGIKTLAAYSGHSQTSTLLKHYVFTTDEAMDSTLERVDEIRPKLTQKTNPVKHLRVVIG